MAVKNVSRVAKDWYARDKCMREMGERGYQLVSVNENKIGYDTWYNLYFTKTS